MQALFISFSCPMPRPVSRLSYKFRPA